MKILLAWDGSSSSDAVIREAARRPWPERTEFLAVTGCAIRRGRAARLRRVISMDLLATSGAVEISQEPRPFTDFGMRVRANQ